MNAQNATARIAVQTGSTAVVVAHMRAAVLLAAETVAEEDKAKCTPAAEDRRGSRASSKAALERLVSPSVPGKRTVVVVDMSAVLRVEQRPRHSALVHIPVEFVAYDTADAAACLVSQEAGSCIGTKLRLSMFAV